jgi:hypothetical protein
MMHLPAAFRILYPPTELKRKLSDSTVRRLTYMKQLGFSRNNGQWGRWNEMSS